MIMEHKTKTVGLTDFEKAVREALSLEVHASEEDTIKEQAKHLLAVARKELVGDAVNWLKTHTFRFDTTAEIDLFISLFKNYMEKEDKK